MDVPALTECLTLARKGKGTCAPNPAVGALVVRGGEVLGSGWHHGPGLPHAEVEALKDLPSELTQGATVYVTLEPCCHYGRTPPCTDLLIRHKVAEVVFAFEDPNPIVKGRGKCALETAGIRVRQVPLPEIDAFYDSYAYWTRERLPRVTAKLALSLDGKIAGPHGIRQQITGAALGERTHHYRMQHDAILTTARTIVADNPQLNVRLAEGTFSKPLFVIDPRLETPMSARIFQHSNLVTLFYASGTPVEAKNAKFVHLPATEEGKISWESIFKLIGERGIHDLWVEAGGTCFSSLLSAKKLHRAFLYIGGKVLGPDAYPAFRDADTEALNHALANAKSVVWKEVGKDALGEVRF